MIYKPYDTYHRMSSRYIGKDFQYDKKKSRCANGNYYSKLTRDTEKLFYEISQKNI